MNLYSNKQKWKIILLVIALLLVGASLFVSNKIVQKVGEQEQQRAKQWADALKKKVELVQLTNRTFTQLRDKEREKMKLWVEATKKVSNPSSFDHVPEFPMQIVKNNVDIPVILINGEKEISGYRNIPFDTTDLKLQHPDLEGKKLTKKLEDSLLVLSGIWKQKNPAFTIEVFEGLFMTYVYADSKAITKLENERDSLIQSFNKELINNDGLVPVVLFNEKSRNIIGTNIEKENAEQQTTSINELIAKSDSLLIDFKNGEKNVLYFGESPQLKQLQYFPYIQFIIIGLFGFIAYLIFSTFRKAEQNQVWAGMAKETAHQLGTPLSSLMAWVQLLEGKNTDEQTVREMKKDIHRLEKVSDRFSKIGSETRLEKLDVRKTVEEVVHYLQPRISKKIELHHHSLNDKVFTAHNPPLIEWVIENICKNAIDAMEGEGRLELLLSKTSGWVHLDIADSGKGIPPKQIKTIFQPGFTTKKRGWGLGLSLVQRIVKEYHKGRVFVLKSEVGKGTTFRISLPLKSDV